MTINTSHANIAGGITNHHDERQWDWDDDDMTETDSGITSGYRGYNERL